MSYGMKRRRAAQQIWAVGEQVKVGFLSLRITGKYANGDWRLINADGSKVYAFAPHQGLMAMPRCSP